MELYSENENYKLYQGDMLDMLDIIKKESVESIVTDPPYELNFMGKGWDNAGVSFQADTWKKCCEVLKPGGYLLAFGGSRTFHRIACAIEDAGFEIRDTIMWLYGSGFPKSMNVGLAIDKKNGVKSKVVGKGKSGNTSKAFNDYQYRIDEGIYSTSGNYEIKEAQNEWQGWGTALKPSFEPIIVARKPFKGSLVDNVIEYGVGGINIDECRVETSDNLNGGAYSNNTEFLQNDVYGKYKKMKPEEYKQPNGRFPANTILTYDETDYEEVCGGFPDNTASYRKGNRDSRKAMFDFGSQDKTNQGYTDSGSTSRYFYCAKASKKDRDEGLDGFKEVDTTELLNRKANTAGVLWEQGGTNAFSGAGGIKKNTHPTVKPTELMQYLVRLVTPNGGTVLDPFNGSGSTGKAVMYENHERDKNYKYVGIELTEEYLPISKARIEYVCNLPKKQRQTDIFDYLGDDNNE